MRSQAERHRVVKAFFDAIVSNESMNSECMRWRQALEIERAIWLAFRPVYEDKVLQLLNSLRIGSTFLGRQLIASPASAHRAACSFVVASDDALASGTIVERVHGQQRAKAEHFESLLRMRSQHDQETTARSSEHAVLKCRKCKSVDITWTQKQTRGADEAMTIFCVCNTCKNRWKMM